MKRIVYLTFYFKPDLCAGSFRNSPLAVELAKQAKNKDVFIDVYTTIPNRYSSFDIDAPEYEEIDNLRIHRILLPPHKSGMIDQILSFWKYYNAVLTLNKGKKVDFVFKILSFVLIIPALGKSLFSLLSLFSTVLI